METLTVKRYIRRGLTLLVAPVVIPGLISSAVVTAIYYYIMYDHQVWEFWRDYHLNNKYVRTLLWK